MGSAVDRFLNIQTQMKQMSQKKKKKEREKTRTVLQVIQWEEQIFVVTSTNKVSCILLQDVPPGNHLTVKHNTNQGEALSLSCEVLKSLLFQETGSPGTLDKILRSLKGLYYKQEMPVRKKK